MSKVICPGCGALVMPTTRSANGDGSKHQQIIPGHNPLPNNDKRANPKKTCPGSHKPLGEIIEGQITSAA